MAYTYTQFLAKHAAKFSKLTPAEKKKRYADYQRGTSAKANGTNRKIRVPRRRNAVKTTSLSTRTPDCLKALAALFSDPFNATVTGLPVFPAPPSQKLRIFSKGTFQSGTSGFGFVAIQPCLAQDYTNSIALSNNVKSLRWKYRCRRKSNKRRRVLWNRWKQPLLSNLFYFSHFR
jgi:hypothetical protein